MTVEEVLNSCSNETLERYCIIIEEPFNGENNKVVSLPFNIKSTPYCFDDVEVIKWGMQNDCKDIILHILLSDVIMWKMQNNCEDIALHILLSDVINFYL